MKTKLFLTGLAVVLMLLFVAQVDSYAKVKRVSGNDSSDAIPAGKNLMKAHSSSKVERIPNLNDDALPKEKKATKQLTEVSTRKLIEASFQQAYERIYRIVIPHWKYVYVAD